MCMPYFCGSIKKEKIWFIFEQLCLQFFKRHVPALRVKAPATLDIETLDCFSNQLRNPEDTIEQLDWDRITLQRAGLY